MSYFTTNGGGFVHVLATFFVVGFFSLILAVPLALLIIAPLGTGTSVIVLRLAPPAWWQGPLTGILVAMALELKAFLFLGSYARFFGEAGNPVSLLILIVLAALAGFYVQHKVLHWPAT